MKTNRNCPGCGVAPGRFHAADCAEEQCPYCGYPFMECECDGLGPDVGCVPADDRLPWTGVSPEVAACRELGWFMKPVPGEGWVRCGAGEPGAKEDLIRLWGAARWDRDEKRFLCVVN